MKNKQNVLCLNCSYLSLHYILAHRQFRAHSQSPVEALTISLVQSPLQLCHVINPSDRTEDRNHFQDSSFPFVECIKIRHGGAENLPEAAAAAASLQRVCSWRSNKPQARQSAGGQNLKLALLKASVCTDPPSCWIGDEVKLGKITKNSIFGATKKIEFFLTRQAHYQQVFLWELIIPRFENDVTLKCI